MSDVFHNAHTQHDLQRLKNLLAKTLDDSGVNPNAQNPINLLNLACGRADESGVLADIFGKNGIHITGLDIRDRELDLARERWKKHLPNHAQAEFHVQDGSKLDHMKQLHDHFDVVFMRHQNFWNGDSTWMNIYDQALHRLDEDGMMVITSYFDREHQQALQAIQSLGAELVCDVKNTDSRLLFDAPGKSVDRHVAIFRKL